MGSGEGSTSSLEATRWYEAGEDVEDEMSYQVLHQQL